MYRFLGYLILFISVGLFSDNTKAFNNNALLLDLESEDYPGIGIIDYSGYVNEMYICALSPYLMIFDDQGHPLFYRKIEGGVRNFKRIVGNRYSYYENKLGGFILLDSTFQILDTIKISEPYITDFHDIEFTDSVVYIIGSEYRVMDLSGLIEGGQVSATVVGSVVQSQDYKGTVFNTWNSFDYFDVLDADEVFVDYTSNFVDFVHVNSIDLDTSGNMIISSRHLNEITKIDGLTGNIIWRLGGKNNEFEWVGDPIIFSGQHSVTFSTDSILSLFDNGNSTHPEYSRGVQYKLNEQEKTITLISEYRMIPDVYTPLMGNFENNNDNVLIGWGKNNENLIFSEYDATGKVTREGYLLNGSEYSYSVKPIEWENPFFKSNIDSVLFGTVDYNQTGNSTIIIQNLTNHTIVLTGFISTDTCYQFTDNFPLTIEGNAQKEMNLLFTPDILGGDYESKVYLYSYTDTSFEQRIALPVYCKAYSEDTNPPVTQLFPSNNSTNISIDSTISIQFNEPVRLLNDESLNEVNLQGIISLSYNDINVSVQFDINDEKSLIEVIPEDDLKPNTKYKITLNPEIEDYNNNSIEKIESFFTTKVSTQVDKIKNSSILIYPNPAQGRFYLMLEPNTVREVEILSLTGSVIGRKIVLKDQDMVEVFLDYDGIILIKVYLMNGNVEIYKLLNT